MLDTDLANRIADVRRFTRFYTQRIGVLRKQPIYAPFSLTEARVLYELATRKQPTASEISAALDLDPAISAASCSASRAKACCAARLPRRMAAAAC